MAAGYYPAMDEIEGRLTVPEGAAHPVPNAGYLLALVDSLRAGTRVELGDGVSFAVLYPSEEELAAARLQDSDQGAMIRDDYGRTCFLLTGDAGPSAWTAVLARGERVQCQVLQLGRRGSLDAASADFLETVRPAVAIVSYGGDGSGEQDVPDALAQTVERLTQQGTTVLRTDQRGSVQVVSDGVRYEVRVER